MDNCNATNCKRCFFSTSSNQSGPFYGEAGYCGTIIRSLLPYMSVPVGRYLDCGDISTGALKQLPMEIFNKFPGLKSVFYKMQAERMSAVGLGELSKELHPLILRIRESLDREAQARAKTTKAKMYNSGFTKGNMTKGNPGDAGFDILAAETFVIPGGGKHLFKTGLHVAIPDGFVGLLWSKSGLAAKFDVEVGAGCIDASYRGEVKVLLRNLSWNPVTISFGQKLTQMVIVPIPNMVFEDVETLEELDKTERGDGGFGSTGAFAGAA